MNQQTYILPVWDTVNVSWEKVYGSKAIIWKALGIIFFIMFSIGFIEGIIGSFTTNLKNIAGYMGNIINFLLQMGVCYIGIKRALDQPINFQLMFRSFEPSIALQLIGVILLQILLFICIGLLPILAAFTSGMLSSTFTLNMITNSISAIALIIATPFFGFFIFYVYIRIMLCYALVLDQDLNAWQAIKTSWHMTRDNFWSLTGLFFIQMGYMILGAISFCIGMIWVLPFASICYGMVYKNLLVNKN